MVNLKDVSEYEKEVLSTVVNFARNRANETPPAEVLEGLLMDMLPNGNAIFWNECAVFWGGERSDDEDEIFVVDTTDGIVTRYTRFRGGEWV